MVFDDAIRSIEVGKKADLVVLNFDNFFAMPMHSPTSTLVYSALGNEPELVMIDGQVVMRDRRMVTVSESEVMRESQVAADGLAKRAGTDRLKRRPWRSFAV